MGKDLIIVESPAKVKTIKKFMGNNYMVQASVGHVRDLPSKTLGVDEETYTPQYQVIAGKEKVVAELRSAAAKADTVYLAPDPDREGEAIAWHVAELIKEENTNVKRIKFNEITPRAVKEALQHPESLNKDLFDAQQARRVLDRLVGYKISPLLWNKIKRGISAGRVQSVALRIIVEREAERRAFVPEEYWLFKLFLEGAEPPVFRADLQKIDGKKAQVRNEAEAKALEERLKGQKFSITGLETKVKERSPVPPFITSSLQQVANQRLGYSAKRTMNVAQKLYEGIELGSGVQALITYMRTDSVRISDDARDEAKDYITSTFGADYYPPKPRVFKSKNSAQDAHEAIRPVNVRITPDSVKDYLTPEQYNVYKLVWNRFLASQMAAAQVEDCVVDIEAANTQWRAKGEKVIFPGFLKLTPQKSEDVVDLPPLSKGQILKLNKLEKEQKFTQPPARYTEAALVKELEEKGIGRPSTYASIISTLQDREYVDMQEKHFVPTDLGAVVCEVLRDNFTQLMDTGFTAQMEELLDKVAEGKQSWLELMKDFSKDFNPTLAKAAKAMKTVKAGVEAGVNCPDCGKPLMVKFGKAGQFLACSGYPDCGYTSNFTRDEQGNIQATAREKAEEQVMGTCEICGKDMVLKSARTGSRFISCSGYPKCKNARPFSTGVPCPKCGKGSLVEKSSRRGKIFYSCDQYPQCDMALWNWPVPGSCPECGGNILERKTLRGKTYISCPNRECKYKVECEEDGSASQIPPQPQPTQGLLPGATAKPAVKKAAPKAKAAPKTSAKAAPKAKAAPEAAGVPWDTSAEVSAPVAAKGKAPAKAKAAPKTKAAGAAKAKATAEAPAKAKAAPKKAPAKSAAASEPTDAAPEKAASEKAAPKKAVKTRSKK